MIRFALLPLLPLLFVVSACQYGLPSTDSRPASPAASLPAATDSATRDELRDDERFVLPGDFSEQTSIVDFEARFGKANVTIVDHDGSRSVVLFPHDPVRRAYVDFHDDRLLMGLAGISVRDAGSRWRGKGGVRIGMSFADLRKANGKPFGYLGFDSRRRAWAHDQWSPALDGDDGRLGALDVGDGEHMYFGVELGLRDEATGAPGDAWPVDDAVSSDDPRYPRLGELVEVTGFSATTSLDDEWQ